MPTANPARIAEDIDGRFQALFPWWADFKKDCGNLCGWSSTIGWQGGDGIATIPGAKPIGLAQWGIAIATAGMISEAVPSAPVPVAGPDPSGTIWITWRVSDSASLALELSGSLIGQTYAWTLVRDGMPRTFTSSSPHDVVAALRSMLVGAQVAA